MTALQGTLNMLNNANKLKSYKLYGLDGKIGNVEEFYFDDHDWKVYYLIVSNSNWSTPKKVLISLHTLAYVNNKKRFMKINLTKMQIDNCPFFYKQDCEKLQKIFQNENQLEINFNNTCDLTGYRVINSNGEIGIVKDFIIDDATWIISSLIVDTRDCWPMKDVLIPAQCIKGIFCAESKIIVNNCQEADLELLHNCHNKLINQPNKYLNLNTKNELRL